MALRPLNHWMLHDDKLANEFDATLNLTPGYNPVRLVEGDADVTLLAPLVSNVNSRVGGIDGVFARNSPGTYRAPLGASLALAQDNVSRHEYSPAGQAIGVLIESLISNQNTNYNANPDAALSGFFFTGDPNAVLSRVSDPARLQESGLALLCTSGFVFQLDNGQGTEAAAAYVLGGTGGQFQHQLSVYARKDPASTGSTFLRLEAISSQEFENTELYEHILHAETPDPATRRLGILCDPGGIAYFVLNQLEQRDTLSSVIIVEGASRTRQTDTLQWPLTNSQAEPVLNDAEGMVAIVYRPKDGFAAIPGSGFQPLLTLTGTWIGLLKGSATSDFYLTDSTNTVEVPIPGNFNADEDHLIMGLWGAGSQQVGFKRGGVVSWSAPGPYAGAYPHANVLALGEFSGSIARNFNARGLYIWKVNNGTDWLESFFDGEAN